MLFNTYIILVVLTFLICIVIFVLDDSEYEIVVSDFITAGVVSVIPVINLVVFIFSSISILRFIYKRNK